MGLSASACVMSCSAESSLTRRVCGTAYTRLIPAGAGQFEEAAAAYEAAGDALSAIRATLAADPERGSAAAAALAMRLGSPAAAAAVVQHCQAAGDHAVWSSLMLAVLAVQSAQCLSCE